MGLPHVLCVYIMASSLEFLGIPEHMNKRDSIFVPSTVLFSCLVLSNANLLAFVLFIMFYCNTIPQKTGSFLMRDRKGLDPDERWMLEEL